MKFTSTNGKSPVTSLEEAIMRGLAPDGGLYMPTEIPTLPADFFTRFAEASFADIAFEAARTLLADDFDDGALRKITDGAFNFDVPLRPIDEGMYALELFHGPTCAFKDFGARFLARILGHFAERSGRHVTILVATSGDTGSAVASGFFNVPGIDVVILYPSGRVSPLQEKQLTGMGGNVTALEVAGAFDDCQRMVKEAFLDTELTAARTLSSANSISVGRLLPQAFYYISTAARLLGKGKPLAISVPCGNYGNLVAGLIAKRMGTPIAKFIAATNQNDVVPEYLRTGIFTPRPSAATISNAMDVGNPSNFARMLALYGADAAKMRADMDASSYSDDETRSAIRSVYERYGHIMDPHGAVAYLGLTAFQERSPGYTGVFLETADPAKFAEVVEPVVGKQVPMPPQLAEYLAREKRSTKIGASFAELKAFLLA